MLALDNPTPEQIKQIAQLLHSDDLGIRSRTTEKLVRIGEPALPALLELVSGDDRQARLAAYVIAGRISPDAAYQVVDKLLSHQDRKARIEGLKLIESAPDGEQKIELYLKALSDKDAGIRAATAEWLGNFKGAKVAKALKAAMKDPETEVREKAKGALARVRGKSLVPAR